MHRLLIAALAAALLLGPAGWVLAGPEDSLTPIQDYTTPKARDLGSKYQPQLLQFSSEVWK